MPKYTVPPYTPEDDASPAFDQSLINKEDLGGEKAAKAKIIKPVKIEKRVDGGTRNHQKQGWIRGR